MFEIIQFLCLGILSIAADNQNQTIEESLDVAEVWSGHPVGFALLTQPPRQYIAFYDDQRRMTVGLRMLDTENWHFARLPETIGWDSHNYVTMTIDDEGYIHLSGNMHCVPLVYFRTTRPHDISSFQRIPNMVGSNEQKCTYPRFLRGADGQLLFTYRDGSSGNGDQIYNAYDLESQTWRRFLDQPLTAGEGLRNAYAHGPKSGPDGFFHLCWVWRDTPDCSTNNNLSYARSRDMLHWETSDGSLLSLPITLETGEIVDPVPVGGGIINGNTIIGFDSQKRVILSYHKFDDQGNTQIYNARREENGWEIYQASQWDYRWEFKGGGAIPFEIRVGGVRVESDGNLSQSYSHPKYGSGQWLIDEKTLEPIGELPKRSSYPPSLSRVQSQFPGMQVRWGGDSGKSGKKGVRYAMRWETLPAHRDRPREGEPPSPVMLRLYKLRSD